MFRLTRFADLQEELRTHLLGKDGGQGAFSRYATTYATTALSQFTGQNNKLLTDDLGCEWFMYTGSNKETSREFCIQLTAKKFIHRSEIPTILTGRIDDYQCAIYEKTGLPYGMIEGTTADNFQCNCGGWNCRHQLVPIADALVPAALRAKFAKDKPAQVQNTSNEDKKNEAYDRIVSAIQSIYTAKTNRDEINLLRSITQADEYQPIRQLSTKDGTVFGFSAKKYDFKDENEIPKNIHLASKLAKSGYDTYLVPNISGAVSAVYILKHKNLYIYAEGKITNGKQGIANAINNGSHQVKCLIIDVQMNLPAQVASNQILMGFRHNESVREVWLYKGSRKIVVTRQQVESKNFSLKFRQEWNK